MNQLPTGKRAFILRLLTEGCSMRAASRLADCSLNTVTKLLVDAGEACRRYQDGVLRGLGCQRIECDEIWSFCGCKEKNVEGRAGWGDVWVWIALCVDTKLIPCWHVGGRDLWAARVFMDDLASRLTRRIQLTTDGHVCYPEAVERAFGSEVDYATVCKVFRKGFCEKGPDIRYTRPGMTVLRKERISGNPDKRLATTSHVERQNLTLRMNNRRFTRLTNAFSKKLENHMASVALHMMAYNFCRIHRSLRVTPAMEAGLSDHIWEMEEVAALVAGSN